MKELYSSIKAKFQTIYFSTSNYFTLNSNSVNCPFQLSPSNHSSLPLSFDYSKFQKFYFDEEITFNSYNSFYNDLILQNIWVLWILHKKKKTWLENIFETYNHQQQMFTTMLKEPHVNHFYTKKNYSLHLIGKKLQTITHDYKVRRKVLNNFSKWFVFNFCLNMI
jgi:hypothetical protein